MMRAVLRVLAFPLQLSVSGAFVLLVALSWVAAAAGLFGIFLFLCVASAFVHLSFAVYRASAMGRRDVPVLGGDEFSPVSSAAPWYALLLAAAVAGVHGLAVRNGGPALGAAWLIVVAVAAPASLALLALNGSLAQAVSPLHIANTVAALRWHYLGMPAILLAAGGAYALLDRLLPLPLANLAGAYLWFVALHALGRIVYLQRDRLGLEPVNPDTLRAEQDRRHADEAREDVLDVAFQEARTDSDRAVAHIQAWVDGQSTPDEALRWAFERSREWPNPNVAVKLALELVDRALAAGDDAEALDVAAWALAVNRHFRPSGPDATWHVARAAARYQRPRVLTALLADFAARFPDDPRALAACITCARVALEKTNETDVARAALDRLQAGGRLEDDPRVRTLRAMLEAARPPER